MLAGSKNAVITIFIHAVKIFSYKIVQTKENLSYCYLLFYIIITFIHRKECINLIRKKKDTWLGKREEKQLNCLCRHLRSILLLTYFIAATHNITF